MLNKLHSDVVDIICEQAEEQQQVNEQGQYAAALEFAAQQTEKYQHSGLNALGLIYQVTKIVTEKYGLIGDKAMVDMLKQSLEHDEIKKDPQMQEALKKIIEMAESRGWEQQPEENDGFAQQPTEELHEDLSSVMSGLAQFAKTTGADIWSRHMPHDPAVYGIALGVIGAFIGLPSIIMAPIVWASARSLWKKAKESDWGEERGRGREADDEEPGEETGGKEEPDEEAEIAKLKWRAMSPKQKLKTLETRRDQRKKEEKETASAEDAVQSAIDQGVDEHDPDSYDWDTKEFKEFSKWKEFKKEHAKYLGDWSPEKTKMTAREHVRMGMDTEGPKEKPSTEAPKEKAPAASKAEAPKAESPKEKPAPTEGAPKQVALDTNKLRQLIKRYISPSEYQQRSEYYKAQIAKHGATNPQSAKQYGELDRQLTAIYKVQRQNIGKKVSSHIKAGNVKPMQVSKPKIFGKGRKKGRIIP